MILRFYFPFLLKEFQTYLVASQNIDILSENKAYQEAYHFFLDELVKKSKKFK